MNTTTKSFEEVGQICGDVFFKKMKDYGPAWRVLRSTSLTDQIYIKVQRIITILEKKAQRVKNESIQDGFMAIFNYALIGLIQMEIGEADLSKGISVEAISVPNANELYTGHLKEAEKRITEKWDYEAWLDMRVESFADLIRMKLIHLAGIENTGQKIVESEVRRQTYCELIDHSFFGIIKSEGM